MSLITIEALSIGYRHGRRRRVTIASDLSVSLEAGTFTVLLGPNGAGKSTFIRTITGLQPPLAGTVRLDGESIHAMSPRTRARQLAVVLTHQVKPWGLTARGLVALGRHPHTKLSGVLSDHDEAVVDRALRATEADVLADRQLAELSDGERQRVMVARALAQEPRAMILDEVTAFLDLPHRVDIMLMLRRLAHSTGTALLLSTHDLHLALRTADRLWLLSPGGRFVVGSPEALVLNGAFDGMFRHDEVHFDRETGGFTLRQVHRGRATVRGEGPHAVWTRRALERIGYDVCGEASLRVDVEAFGGVPAWKLTDPDRTRRCGSIDEVVAALAPRSDDGTPGL
jgi:iron complex transport system ATP-binding protein